VRLKLADRRQFSKVILAICYQKNANPPTSITYGKVST